MGLDRDGGEEQLTDELIGQVVVAVRSDRPNGHGAAWESLGQHHHRIVKWVGEGLTVVKIGDLLGREGVMVPARTLHRYCTERTDYQGRSRVAGRCRWQTANPAKSARSTSLGWGHSSTRRLGGGGWCMP